MMTLKDNKYTVNGKVIFAPKLSQAIKHLKHGKVEKAN